MDFKFGKEKWLTAAKQLVSTVTDIKDDQDENFDLCLQYVASNFTFHKFYDFSSADVIRTIERLIDKMMIHSDLEKAAKLRGLVDKLITHKNFNCNSVSTNIYSSVLLLLLRLSNSKFSHALSPDNERAKVFSDEEDNFDWDQYLRGDDDDIESAVDNYVDDLSDWSEDESDENPDLLHVKIIPPKRDDSGIDISADAKSMTSANATTPSSSQQTANVVNFQLGTPFDESSAENHLWFRKHTHPPYWKGVSMNLNLGDTLSSNLNTEWENYLRESGVLSVNENSLFMTERQIIREVLWMLLAQKTYIFNLNEQTMKYSPMKNFHMSHLTPKALFYYLDQFCDYASTMVKLSKFTAKVTQGVGKFGCTFEAFASSLNTLLMDIKMKIIDVERVIIQQETKCSLSDVLYRLSPTLDILKELSTVYEKGIEQVHPESSIRYKSYNLIKQLYDYLPICSLLNKDCSVLSLFLDTIKPYFGIMEAFIMKGIIDDPFEEFYISRCEDCEVRNELFWIESFQNHLFEMPGYIDFIENITKTMLTAGKSVQILNVLEKRQLSCETDCNMFEYFVAELNKHFALPKTENKPNVDDKSQVDLDTQTTQAIPDLVTKLQDIGVTDAFLIRNFCQLTTITKPILKTQSKSYNMEISHHPLHHTINSILTPLVKNRCSHISVRFMQIMKAEFNIFHVLGFLRKMYLMEAGDVMFNFYSSLFNQIRHEPEKVNNFKLNLMLRDAVSCKYLIESSDISLCCREDFDWSVESPIKLLNKLVLKYQVSWPANLICNNEAFKMYNDIFIFLIQVKYAKYSLDQLRFKDLKNLQLTSEEKEKIQLERLFEGKFNVKNKVSEMQMIHLMHLLRSRLSHFINVFHNYLMDKVLATAALEIEKRLENAENLEEIMEIHTEYLNNIYKQCGCHKSVLILKEPIVKILELVHTFNGKWLVGLSKLTFEDLMKMESLFMKCYQFLSSFVSRLVKQGSHPHWEYLAMSLDAKKLPELTKLQH